ncbi:MAG: hypothetical protein PVF15_00325, partial [Candidatus Bathyarchaeota archaeon]
KRLHKGYKPTRLGKKIGKYLAQERWEEANLAWKELLERHKLFKIFEKYFSSQADGLWTVRDFGSFLKRKAHAKWDLSVARSRISRLCELFAEKGLIEYQNDYLSPIDFKHKERGTFDTRPPTNQPPVVTSARTMNRGAKRISVPINSWPIRIEIKMDISDRTDPRILELIFSFLKDMRTNSEGLRIDVA